METVFTLERIMEVLEAVGNNATASEFVEELLDISPDKLMELEAEYGFAQSQRKDKYNGNRNICYILTIIVKNKVVTEVKNSNNDIIYTLGDDCINDFEVGWFGKVFDYYTNIISNSIMDYNEEYDSYIWGVFY